MSERKVQPTHLRRAAVVYVRQSTAAQVEQNRESTRRQYDLTERARQLGWRADQTRLSTRTWDCPARARRVVAASPA